MAQSKYGINNWPDSLDPRLIELALYSSDGLRQLGKPLSRWEHLRNCIKGFLPDSVFKFHRWVDDFGEMWCEHSGMAVWGAGGTTKSGIIGCFTWFDLLADPAHTLTVMITNPQEKHWDRCFSKMLMWRNAMPDNLKIGRLVKSPKPALATVEADVGSRRGVLCVSIEPGETAAQVAKKVGAHAPRTRLILEEGQGLPDAAIDIGTNLFIGSVDKKGCVIGNPTTWSGNALGTASMPMDGDTERIDREQPDWWFSQWTWDERPGKTLVFDATRGPTFDSPAEAKRLEGIMIQPRDVENARSKPGGEKSLMFWQQIRGRIAPQGEALTLFNAIDWEAHGVAVRHQWTGPVDEYVGADLSLGGDNIPLYRVGLGQAGPLGLIAQVMERSYIEIDITKPDRSGQIARKFADKVYGQWRIPVSHCALDCSGQQGAIADRIEYEMHKLEKHNFGRCYRIRTEEAVTERVLSNGRVKAKEGGTQRETAKDRYKDRATEVLFNVVEMLQGRVLYGLDVEVKHQLCTRGYDEKSMEEGECKAEKKKPWRLRNGNRSPDELDSVACVATMLLEKKLVIIGKDTTVKPEKVENIPQWMTQKRKVIIQTSNSRVASAMRRK